MDANNKASIYMIVNKISGKKYVGQTIRDVNVRFKEHIASSKKYDPGCRAIALAIKSYGEDAFELRVLHQCRPDELDHLESEEIEKQNAMTPSGYNLYQGGRNTYTGHSGSARDKISKSQRVHKDNKHNIPRYMQYVPPGEHGEGYMVAIPNVKFAHFTATVLSLDEKYDLALRYLTTNEREEILTEYNNMKNSRRVNKIVKQVTINDETYELPAYFIWAPSDQTFIVRLPGKKAKQFGNKSISMRENYEKANKYYIEQST